MPGVGETEEESDIDSETEDQQPDFNLGNCDSIQLTNFPPVSLPHPAVHKSCLSLVLDLISEWNVFSSSN